MNLDLSFGEVDNDDDFMAGFPWNPNIDEKELVEKMDSMPLFMEYEPGEGDEGSTAYQAIKALQSEETPEELAENFRESGNRAFSIRRYHDASEYYTQALRQSCTNSALNSQILSNRAQAQFMIKNYRNVVRDCMDAIKLDSDNVKAYYRAGKALFELEKYEEATSFCRLGLNRCKDASMKKIFRDFVKKVKEKAIEVSKKREKRIREENLKLEATRKFNKACADRGISFEARSAEFSQISGQYEDFAAYLDESTGEIHWPVLLLYPETGISEFVQDWNENICLYDMLSTMFPSDESCSSGPNFAPWDEHRKYCMNRLHISVENSLQQRSPVPNLSISLGDLISSFSPTIRGKFPLLYIESR